MLVFDIFFSENNAFGDDSYHFFNITQEDIGTVLRIILQYVGNVDLLIRPHIIKPECQ